VLILGQKDDHP